MRMRGAFRSHSTERCFAWATSVQATRSNMHTRDQSHNHRHILWLDTGAPRQRGTTAPPIWQVHARHHRRRPIVSWRAFRAQPRRWSESGAAALSTPACVAHRTHRRSQVDVRVRQSAQRGDSMNRRRILCRSLTADTMTHATARAGAHHVEQQSLWLQQQGGQRVRAGHGDHEVRLRRQLCVRPPGISHTSITVVCDMPARPRSATWTACPRLPAVRA
jgi:hypothetical protein